MSNFVPHKIISCRDKDAPWMSPEIKQALYEKAKLYKKYVKNGRKPQDYILLRNASSISSNLIKKAKENFYASQGNKLNDPNISHKKYWTILNSFLNKKKVPQIPPIKSNSIFITNFQEKATLFNNFFAQQCTLINTPSILPNFSYRTNHRLNSIDFNIDKIVTLIRALDGTKAHGWDDVSAHMLNICDDSIALPLKIIFEKAFSTGSFPKKWKKANIIPVHKKADKSIIKNYRPISLLPLLGKLFEKCIFDSMYSYFEDNNLFHPCQSGFRKRDSCISQLLAITHEISCNFDANPPLETRAAFLDMSKAFDKVWHEGLVHKLKSYGIEGSLLSVIKSFLSERYQRVVLNGQTSSWKSILAGVPQGSILGPLFFLIYINDLPNGIKSSIKIFADDTSLFSVMRNGVLQSYQLNMDLCKIAEWACQWKMSFNPDPSKQAVEVRFSTKNSKENLPNLIFNNNNVTTVDSQKHLGLVLDSKLEFNLHLEEKFSKAKKGIGLISRLRKDLPRSSLICIYKSFIRPHLDYGDIIYDRLSNQYFTRKIESVQYNAALAITGAIPGTSQIKLYQELGLEKLSDRRLSRRLCFFYKIQNGLAPSYLDKSVPGNCEIRYDLRIPRPLNSYWTRTKRFEDTFFPFCSIEWNKLKPSIRNLSTQLLFKNALLRQYRPSPKQIFNVHNPYGVMLLSRLRLGLIHLNEHLSRHKFAGVNPYCMCKTNSRETTVHFLLHCPTHAVHRGVLFDNLQNKGLSVIPYNDLYLANLLLYGSKSFKNSTNKDIICIVIKFLIHTNRFNGPLI